jgi:hypothetical protein
MVNSVGEVTAVLGDEVVACTHAHTHTHAHAHIHTHTRAFRAHARVPSPGERRRVHFPYLHPRLHRIARFGHSIVWPWHGLAMAWFGHSMVWPCHDLAMP